MTVTGGRHRVEMDKRQSEEQAPPPGGVAGNSGKRGKRRTIICASKSINSTSIFDNRPLQFSPSVEKAVDGRVSLGVRVLGC